MKEAKFEVGDKVRVTDNPVNPSDHPAWMSSMDSTKGKEAVITEINDRWRDDEQTYKLDVESSLSYAERWLSPINKTSTAKLYPIY